MADQRIRYLKIRKKDATGKLINLDPFQAAGEILTIKQQPSGYNAAYGDYLSQFKIITVQETQTAFILEVEDVNTSLAGGLSQVFNVLTSSYTLGPTDIEGDLESFIAIPASVTTGAGKNALFILERRDPDPNAGGPGVGSTGSCNFFRVAQRGNNYEVNDIILFQPADSGLSLNLAFTLDQGVVDEYGFGTEGWPAESSKELITQANIPYYASFSMEDTYASSITDIPPYSGSGGQYSYIFDILPFKPQTINPRPPFSRDSIKDLTNKSAYEFGMQPPFPVEWVLEFKGLKSDAAGHFFFNMFQYEDKYGDQMNRFCGKRFAVDKVVDNFRGFSISSSIRNKQGSATFLGTPYGLTGPVKLLTTTQDITISGSVRADFITSGSSWYPGVSRSPIDFDQAGLNPTVEWAEATWSMKYPDTASFYMMNYDDNLPPYTSSLNSAKIVAKDQDLSTLIGVDEFVDPINGLWAVWGNSDYNPTLGNVNQQRRNSRIMVIEYNHQTGSGTPSNRFQIISRSAELAEVPDSNYTMRSMIYPRYLGSRLYSADYNFYTKRGRIGEDPNYSFGFPGFQPKMTQSLLQELANPVIDQFLNGDTCSIAPQFNYPTNSNATASKQWFGDISYGKEAAVNRNPIYIAHFQKSIDDYLYWGSRKFDLDALIEIPLEDITGEQGFQAVPIPLEGEGERQFDVAMTFEAGRDAAAIFNQVKYRNSGVNGTGSFAIDFSTIPRRKRKKTRRRRIKSQAGEILDGGMKYTLLYTNEAAETGSEQYTTTPFYAYRKNRRKIKAMQATTIPEQNQSNVGDNEFTESIQMVTGSTEYGVDENFFILSGSVFPASGSSATYKKTPEPIPFARISKRPNYNNSFFARLFFGNSINNFYALGGPQLATIHTHNYYLYNNIKAGIFDQYAAARNLAFMPNVSSKRLRYYWKFLPNSSGAPRYENDREPFLILPGDEIRVEAEISTAAYEGHTGSLKAGFDPSSQGGIYVNNQVYNNPAGYAWNSYFRSLNSGYNDNGLGFSGDSYNLKTYTNGQGVGAEMYVETRDNSLIGGEWVVNQTTGQRGWLGMIVDGYFCSNANYRGDVDSYNTIGAAAGNTYYGIQPDLTTTAGNPQTNYVTGENVVGEDAKFDITFDSSGNPETIAVTAPGKNYKYGDRFRFLGNQLGGATPADDINMLIGLRIGVGKAPTSKMAFDAVAMHPDAGVDSSGAAWTGGAIGTLNFDISFTGETGFEDAKATKIRLNRVGAGFGDEGYLVWTSKRLRAYGAGTGKCIQEMYGTGCGITGYSYEDVQPSGSQKAYEDLVIEIQPGSSKCGPVNMQYSKPGKGYKAGDFLYVSKDDSNWFGPGPAGDLVIKIGPDDVYYQDTSKTTQNITFQVLAVSQSTYWSGSAIPDGVGDFEAPVPFPALKNQFSWLGLATGSGEFNGDNSLFNFVNLISYVDGAVGGGSGVPGDNGQANGPDGATSCTTTLQNSPNGGAGSGLKVDLVTNNQVITSIVPTAGNLGSGYCVGDVIKVDVSTGTGWVGSAGTDFTFTVPAQAIEEFEGFMSGSVTHQGRYGGIADKIFVHPNPKEALYGIDSGEIKNVTFRRRTPSDQSALLMLDAPSGSKGRLTPSGDGYLIPSDLTPTQKKNALSIINKLNAQNAFRKNN